MSFELAGLLIVAAVLLIFLYFRPGVVREGGGRVLAFVGLFLLPVLALSVGFQEHMEKSKEREFCLSCHVMRDYGKSLLIDDSEYIPAVHYQNNYVPRKYACFTCHTTYTLYGDEEAKLRGLRHLFVNYVTRIPDTLALYSKYQNRECLHCHGGSRRFEGVDAHTETDTTLASLKSGRQSCLTSGCHDLTHDVRELHDLDFWEEKR